MKVETEGESVRAGAHQQKQGKEKLVVYIENLTIRELEFAVPVM